MPLRTLLCTTAVALVGLVSAQSQLGAVGDPDVQAALTNLRQQPNIFLRLQGTVTTGNVSHLIDCDQFWSQSTGASSVPLVQSELLEYQDNKLVGRLVADGTTVWTYNLIAREYQSGLYGRYDTGPAPANYLRDVLAIMRSGANSYGSFTTRLLDQTYSGMQPTYQTWLPGATVTETTNPNDPTKFDVVYTLGNPARRQVIFHMSTATNQTELLSIDYQGVSTVGAQSRVITWTLTPYTVIPSSANFQAYAYSQIPGWRIVTARN
jgi:hypothetical protein